VHCSERLLKVVFKRPLIHLEHDRVEAFFPAMALEEVGGLVLLLDEFEAVDNVIWPQLFSAVVEVLHLRFRWLELLHEVVLLL